MSTPARPGSAWQRQGIATLVHALRAGGFPVGTSEASDATRLLIDLAAREPELDDPSRLRTRLRPIFCKTREEQERFDAIFEEWARRTVLMWQMPAPDATPAILPQPAEPVPARGGRWVVVTAIAVAVALVVAALAFWSRGTTVAPSDEAREQPVQPVGGGAPAPPPAVDALAAADTAPVMDRYVPAVRYNRELRTIWFWLLLALPVLPLFGISLPAMVLSRTRMRRSSDPLILDPRPLAIEARRLVPSIPQEVSERLARHVRSAGLDIERLARRPVLDVRSTIEATIRNRGIPTLRFSHSRIHPSYLLLVDVANERDPRGRLFWQWAERLQREKLDVEILLIRIVDDAGSPSVMFCPAGAAARDSTTWKPLARLRAPAFGERLIVISDGGPLVDADGAWRPAALRGRLYRWRDRVLFTPVEPRDWGLREEAIERKERAADPGFIVLPLEESALSAWSDLVLTGQLSMMELSDPQRFPALLRRGRVDQYLHDEPPPAEQIEKLIAQLRVYLGTWGFEWLAACAVPPLVRWELTLLLGQDVMKGLPAPLTERDVNEALARNYRRLVRLPWMQRETMPQWLRLRLLAELPASRQGALQRLVRDRLGSLSPHPVPDGIVLSFERPPGERTALERRTGGERAEDRADRRWEGDPLYLGYMSGLTPEQLVLRAPREWAGWARKIRLRRPSGLRGWMARLRDRSTSWWARLAWRDGLPHLGMNQRTGVIASVLAVPLVILLVAASQWPLDADVRFADNSLFVEKPRLMAWPGGSGQVFSVAFSPDGNRIASAGEGGVQVFDAHTAAPIGDLVGGQNERVRTVAFSPDGTQLVTGSERGTLRLWDSRTRTLLTAAMAGHSDEIESVGFTPDGRRIVSASLDGTAQAWDAETGEAIGGLLSSPGSKFPTRSVAVSPDGAWLVVGLPDGSLIGYDRQGAAFSRSELEPGKPPIVHLAFSPSGKQLVSATGDGTMRLLEAGTWDFVGEPLRGHADWIRSIAFSPDEKRLASAGNDRTLRLWDAQTGAPIGEPLYGHTGVVWSVVFSPDGTQLVSGGEDGMRVWEARAAEPVGEPWRGHTGEIHGVAFSTDGTRVVSGSADGTLRIWDARTGTQIGAPLQGNAGAVFSVAVSPDGTRVASADAAVRLWDARAGVPIGQPRAGAGIGIAFSPDGTRLAASGGSDATVRLWDARTGNQLGELGHQGSRQVVSIAFSPDGTQLVSSGLGGSLRFWDLRTMALVRAVDRSTGLTDTVWSVAFSSDGTRLALGEDRTVRVWDARTGVPIGEPLRGHTAIIITVTFSPDGTRIVSSAMDGTLRLWDARTGASIGSPITSRDGAIQTVAFSPDGRYLATAISGTRPSSVATQPPPQPQQQPEQQAPLSPEQRLERERRLRLADRRPQASPPVNQPPVLSTPQPTGPEAGPHVIQLWRVDPWPVRDSEPTGDRLRAAIVSRLTQFEGQTLMAGATLIASVLLIATARLRRRRAIVREMAAAAAPA